MSGIRRLQLVELEIFKEVKRICEKHSLRYYLIGGTLLGAVRHEGFIPWDDDIDIGMPRPDFDRFSSLCSVELKNCYFWQTYFAESNYPLIFGKCRLNNTQVNDFLTQDLPIHQGISIDIFPIDGTPNFFLIRIFHKYITRIIINSLMVSMKQNDLKSLLFKVTKIIPRTWFIALYEIMAHFFNYDQSQIVVNAGGAWGYDKESVPREWFATGEILQFEDIHVPGPKEWDKFLTHVYNNYMQLPPMEKRKNHYNIMDIKY